MTSHRQNRALAFHLSLAVWALLFAYASASKGYDKEENPTNVFKGYCVPLNFDQQQGLCQFGSKTVKVCAASTDSLNPLSATAWYFNEVANRRAPHNDKALVGQAFDKLQLFFTNWVCKQLGEDVLQKTDLSDAMKQEAACNFVWRRDQEIQKQGSPQPEEPWGRFTYDPPGDANQTTFTFKGIPKNQCSFDYDCRAFNDPGQVFTCCDYCEWYFSRFCEVPKETIYRFCMEKVHCVCNSVTKSCAKPDRDRGVSEVYPDGKLYPVYGAPCSPAPLHRPSSWMALVLAGVVALVARAL
mmetsp:Transcript_40242/g.95549  ORF Transcript_40242/g.95549 Transcript_40242/m.95549 type:complete len:298 (+) Transcript_40242:243-1136(+)